MKTLKTIYLIHHSHTDLGYTHPQPTVRFLHQRFIDEALDLIEATAHYPAGAKTKWTCETTFPVFDWLKTATPKNIDRFLAADKIGSIEVTACWGVMDQSAPMQAWDFMMRKIEHLRSQYKMTIRSAMHSDINGVPWSLPDILAAHGISRFSMAINEHFGKSSLPRPRSISRGPRGAKLKLWNGLHYNANQYFGIPQEPSRPREGVKNLERWLQDNHYDRDFLLFQVTRPDASDNGGPDPRLSDFVRAWNALNLQPRMEIVTLSGFFDAIDHHGFDSAPEVTGEWTDFWNFGATSTPCESSLNRRVYSMLADVQSLCDRLPANQSATARAAAEYAVENAATYDEHTWGSNASVGAPFNEASRSGLLFKQHYAYQAEAHAKMARAEALRHLASAAASEVSEPHMLIVNTLPWERRETIDIPIAWLRTDICPTVAHQHRIQYFPVNIPGFCVPLAQYPIPENYRDAESVSIEVSIPPQGSKLLKRKEIFANGHPQIRPEITPGSKIENTRFSIELDPTTGGLKSLIDKTTGREWLASSPLSPIGVPVRETPQGGKRSDIQPEVDWKKFMGYKPWRTNWQALRTPMAPSHPAEIQQRGQRLTLRRSFSSDFANGATLEVILDETRDFVELIIRVDFRWDERPCAWYVPLEFAITHPVFDYENCDAIIRLGRDQVPSANMDYQTVQRWARVSDDFRGMTVVPRDTLMMSMGDFTFGRMTTPATPRRPLLLAWLHSNYWDTNYAASCFGLFEARFFLKPSETLDDQAATNFAESATRPLIIQPLPVKVSNDAHASLTKT